MGELQKKTEELKDLVFAEELEDKKKYLNRYHINKINQILTNNELNVVCNKISNQEYLKGLTYGELTSMYEIMLNFTKSLKKTKEEIDIKIFFDEKKVIDLKKLKEKFKLLNREKYFPNFDFKKFKELLENPPIKIKPQDGSSNNYILYDIIIVKKYLYAILQMVINEMDLVVIFTGTEGMGKSIACSQDMSLLYYLLKELKLIKYEYKIEDMWFNTVSGFNQAEDKFFDERFRILGLDEGNELNSQDWQDDNVKTFFQRLRRERERQRIKLISIPQLVELLKGVAISRANFIFHMESKDDIKTGTLNKGFCKFFIIPRTIIYSYYNHKRITRDSIVTTLTNHLKDKNTGYKSLPNSILIKKFRRSFIWGFDKDVYKEQLKESNKTYSVGKGHKTTEYQAYLLYRFIPALKNWQVDKIIDKQAYSTLQKWMVVIKKMFEENPDKKIKYDVIYEEMIRKNKAKVKELL